MQKRITMLVGAALLVLLAVTPALAQTPVVCASTHTVAAGEWLSKIAQTAYGDAGAYFPIFSATNAQAISDSSFHFIDNPDEIEIGWKLCIPAQPVPPAGLSEQELDSATYKSDFGVDGVVTLTDGKYSAPAAPGSASMNTVSLGKAIAYGEIDGIPSAALVLVESGGGSGTFSTLHLVRSQDGKVNDVALASLGDRINLTSLYFQDNKIVVGMTTQGPDEPMCCGTQRVLNTYALNGDKLDTASTQVVGKVEQEPTTQPGAAQPTPAPEVGATEPTQNLMGAIWKWTGSQFSDGKTTTPTDPNNYLIEFLSDGTLGVRADCNRLAGTFTQDGNNLTIALGPSTLVACPEGSLGDEYVRQLGLVSSYFIRDGKLVMEFKFDSGSMTFEASAPAGLAGTSWDVINYNNGNQGVVTAVNGTKLTLAFGADGRVSGSAGCNTFNGSYTSENGGLNIGPLASTRKLCPEPAGVMEQEAQYLAALQKAATYEIAGDTLTIRDASDATLVVAKVAAPPPGLGGTKWDVVNLNNGKQAVVSVLEGPKLTLAFGADNRVGGNSGCNTFSGTYESGDGKLTIGPLASTLMACPEPAGVMEQEAQYLAALQKAATYEIAGDTLTIRDAEGA
ncbi:MAG: META domain-containing protein, partial [Anaerolineae bacterium]|nr:META domain-containing protein [Anaerolineae bacterium]